MVVKFYRVGGAVRDFIMDRPSSDVDYVVTGANHDYMTANGFKVVGQDFPVYLDAAGDEYALARKERSTGDSYTNFQFFTENVTIEEDLMRRDLTVNAIAQDMDTQELVDPYGGVYDIHEKVFRPVSEAFKEDPVRVLRVARLRARFGADWELSKELCKMVWDMKKKGVLNSLQPDRVWKEMSRALMEPFPRLFFDSLLEMDVLDVIFPEIYKLLVALESRWWHPEGNAYEHTMLVLTQAAEFEFDLETRYACLLHDIGKSLTKFENLPKHYGHDVNGVALVEAFSKKYRVPADLNKRAKYACRYHMSMHKLDELNAKTVVDMFDECRGDQRMLDVLLNVGICDERGRKGSEYNDVQHLFYLIDMAYAYNTVKFADVFPNGETNVNKIKAGMRNAKISALKKVKRG